MSLIYLASPHSHPDPKVRHERYEKAVYCAGKLISKGIHVFSPIVHTHPIAERFDNLPKNWNFWKEYDTKFLTLCMAMYILTIDGWQQSVGIAGEVEICKGADIPISYVDEEGNGRSEL